MRSDTKGPPVLSIVVVTFNADQFLRVTLDSISLQRGVDGGTSREVLVIDGDSTDETVRIAQGHSVVTRVISEPDRGIYDAMNKGARLARGEWIQFLNAGDCYTDETSLARVLDALRHGGPRLWATSAARYLSSDGEWELPIRNLPHRWLPHAYGLQPHCHQAVWVRRDAFVAALEYSLEFGTAGDFDWVLRLGMLSRPLEIDTCCIDYLGGGISDNHYRENARLQHQVRVERLGLGRVTGRLDAALGLVVRLYGQTRATLGTARRRLRRSAGRGV